MQLEEEDKKGDLRKERGEREYQEVRVREGYKVRGAVWKVSFKRKD